MAKIQYTAGFRTRPAAPRSAKLRNSSASAQAGAPSVAAAAPQESLFDIVYENDRALLKVKDKFAGLFTTGFLSARGKDSSGTSGGGTDLESVWASLSTATDAFKGVLIDGAHIPSLGIGKIVGLQDALDGKLGTDDLTTAQWAAINSGVTDVALSGLQTSVSTLESGLASEITRAKAKEDATAADLAAETTRAMRAENQLSNDIMGETIRATKAEAALSDLTGTLSAKLSGIEAGAQVNVIESVKLNGTALSYIITALVLLLAAASLGTSVYVCDYRNGRKTAVLPAKTVTDTLVVRDTIRLEKPVEIEKLTTDTMLVSVTDTLRLRDTLYLSLPREEKTYRDSTYTAVVSGYRPSLDRIEVYRRTVTVTTDRYIEAPKWSFGVSAGPGVLLDYRGQPHLGIGAVIGLQYRF